MGGETAAVLARRLSEAVSANTNGHRPSNGAGPIEVPSARDVAIDVCRAILAETDEGTAEHSDDVVLITEAIGQRMGFSGPEAEDLLAAACLHDIGKVWVPRRILEKPGRLTDEEWALMRRHTLVGEEILSSVPELAEVGRLVRHSHERWDGRGYPDGLYGQEIPLGSRIIFCADAFHAIRCDRPYRAGSSANEALAEIRRCAGTQFDPTVATALEEVVRERRRRPHGPRSSRLFALLMCLVVGGAGTAIARSDLLAEPSAPPPSSAPAPPPACGTAGCPTVVRPVGGLSPVGIPGISPGPRVLHPGLPGRLHGGIGGGKRGLANGKGKGNRGKREQAKQDHAAKSNGKALGHSNGSHSAAGSSSSHGSETPSSSSSGGSGGGHHSGGGSRHPSGGSGSSHGNSGGNGNGALHGNSGNAGGSSGSHGK
jgi:hypothetical protein